MEVTFANVQEDDEESQTAELEDEIGEAWEYIN